MSLSRKQKSHAIKTARKWLRFKLNSESPFKKELKSYFYQQSRRIKSGLDPETMAPILEKQYKRIIRNISGIRIKEVDDFGLEDKILYILSGRAIGQAVFTDKTTNKLFKRASEMARQELSAEGITFPAQSTLNKVTAAIFRSLNSGRVGGIAVSETQMMTEKIKQVMQEVSEDMMEAAIVESDKELAQAAADMNQGQTFQEIADNIDLKPPSELFPIMTLLEKAWVTMGDKKVRPWHNDANFQTVPINKPFIVKNQMLMFPGDTSMGASLDNTNGCRCSSVNL